MKRTIRINGIVVTAKSWARMPHQGLINPVPVFVRGERQEAQLTQGGVPLKRYSYFRLGGLIYYVPGHVEPGSKIQE